MMTHSKVLKCISVFISFLFFINNIAWASPDISYNLSQTSSLRASAAGNTEPGSMALQKDLLNTLEAFPVKIVDVKKESPSQSEEFAEQGEPLSPIDVIDYVFKKKAK